MTTDMEQVLVKGRICQWRNLRSGWLVIRPGQAVVYRRKFIRGVEEVKNLDMSQLAGAEQDTANNSLRLIFHDLQGEPYDETFFFDGEEQAESVNNVLTGLLKEAEEQKKHMEEEAARLERERQERMKQIRELFAGEIWETAEFMWLIVRADYSMVYAVIAADWNKARQQYSIIWQQVDRMKKSYQIEIMTVLEGLDEAVSTQDGREVIKRASDLLKQLSEQFVRREALWSRWQEQKDMLSAVSPNCNHLPYFLLFSASHFEALLAAWIEDWTGVDAALSLLRPSGAILHHCFGLELDKLLETANSAAEERNVDLFTEASDQVESTVLASFKARSFKFESVEQQLEVNRNGPVSG